MVKFNRLIGVPIILGLVVLFLGCAASQKTESAGQYIDDSVITTKVKAVILDEPTLKTLQIGVKTFKGVVQLSGFVDTKESVTKAGQVAATVEGVVSVENSLIVK